MCVLLCLTITLLWIPSIMEHLPHAALTTILPSIQPLAQPCWLTPHSSLHKLCIGATGFLLDSWTLKMKPICCPKTSVRNYDLFGNYPKELLRSGSLKSHKKTLCVCSGEGLQKAWQKKRECIVFSGLRCYSVSAGVSRPAIQGNYIGNVSYIFINYSQQDTTTQSFIHTEPTIPK